MHALRFPFAAGSGLFVTLAVFTLLWSFVSRPNVVRPAVTTTEIKFTRQRIEEPIETKPPPKPDRPPPVVVPPSAVLIGGQPGVGPVQVVPARANVDVRGGGRGGLTLGEDREAIPYFRPPPEYPVGPATHNVEGWVQVQFSISAAGTVKDAVVVDSSPKGAFEDAALKAIARWRYQPKVEGGVAVERVGLQTVIRFELQ